MNTVLRYFTGAPSENITLDAILGTGKKEKLLLKKISGQRVSKLNKRNADKSERKGHVSNAYCDL